MNLNLLKSLRGSNLVPSSVLSGDHERVRAIGDGDAQTILILLLGMVLGSYVPMSAQTRVPQAIPAQDRTVMSMTVIPTAPAPLFAPSLLLPENPGKSAAAFSYLFAWAHERDQGLAGLKSLSPMREVKTLFLTQSMLPLLYLWGGRLRLDGFTSTRQKPDVR